MQNITFLNNKEMEEAGAGILDLSVAGRCYKIAKEKGMGTVLPYWL